MTLKQLIETLESKIDSLQEPIFDLVDPADFKEANNIFQKFLQPLPEILRRGAFSPDLGVMLSRAKMNFSTLEKILSGQMSLLASTPVAGKRIAVLDSKLKATFDSILDILDAIPAAVEQETTLKISPARPGPRQPSKPSVKAPKTFDKAKADILDALKRNGWAVVPGLKIPHATHPNGDFRLWFKPQAVYFTRGGDTKNMGRGLSLYGMFEDLRFVDPNDFVRKIVQRFKLLVDRFLGSP